MGHSEGNSAVIQALREQIGMTHGPFREYWPAPNLPSGIPQGALVEMKGNAATEWLLSFFKEHPQNYIYWCEREPQINPTAICQRGVDLRRIKFVNSAGDLQQPLRMALESKAYPFLVAPNRFDEVRIFQRMHLLAEKAKATLFLMTSEKFSSAWPISLQLDINFSSEGLQVDVHRQK